MDSCTAGVKNKGGLWPNDIISYFYAFMLEADVYDDT